MKIFFETIIQAAKQLFPVLHNLFICICTMAKSILANPALTFIVLISIVTSVLGIKKYK